MYAQILRSSFVGLRKGMKEGKEKVRQCTHRANIPTLLSTALIVV